MPLTISKAGMKLFARCAVLGLVCSALPIPHSAFAQEVQWRTEYAAARREATEKNRPLLLDFGTDSCYWCKQLDTRTFSEPAVARLLNERFIPLKINAQRDADLAGRLRIQTYPTLVIAAPDGRILGTQEGFIEAVRFHEQLQRVLAAAPAPDRLTLDCEEAAKAAAAGETDRALGLLRKVLEDGKEGPVSVKARKLLQEIEQQAANRLVRARELAERGQLREATDAAGDLARAFAGTRAAVEAGQLVATLTSRAEPPDDQSRARRARELLALARDDYRHQNYLCCLDRCELLTTTFGDLPEGSQAAQLAAEIKANPEWLKQACDGLSDRLGGLYLALAESWLKNGQPNQAVIYLERVLQTFPGTRQAEAAQLRLLQIQGPASQAVESNEP